MASPSGFIDDNKPPPGPMHNPTVAGCPETSSQCNMQPGGGQQDVSGSFPTTGLLHVTIGKARGIKDDEYWGLGEADPYVKISRGGEVIAKSKVDKNAGSKPVWNQKFAFHIEKSADDVYNDLNLSIFNKNHKIPRRQDTPLGSCHIKGMGHLVTRHGNRVSEQWYPVFLNNEQKGQISLALEFCPMTLAELANSAHLNGSSVHVNDENSSSQTSDDDDWEALQVFLAMFGIAS